MVVTTLEELSKTRIKVYLDGEFAFVLYKGELHLYGIQVGEMLQPENYNEILNAVLPKRAKLRAMNLLKSREYTEKQLYRKLKDGLYPEEVIAEALEYVASFHYTDDLRYALTYITNHENDKSHRRIEMDLVSKGIDRDVLKKAWEKWEEQGGEQDELQMACKLLKKRGYQSISFDRREYAKAFAFLARKGFSNDIIQKALGESRMELWE